MNDGWIIISSYFFFVSFFSLFSTSQNQKNPSYIFDRSIPKKGSKTNNKKMWFTYLTIECGWNHTVVHFYFINWLDECTEVRTVIEIRWNAWKFWTQACNHVYNDIWFTKLHENLSFCIAFKCSAANLISFLDKNL